MTKEPCMPTNEPCILTKELFKVTKEPCIPTEYTIFCIPTEYCVQNTQNSSFRYVQCDKRALHSDRILRRDVRLVPMKTEFECQSCVHSIVSTL